MTTTHRPPSETSTSGETDGLAYALSHDLRARLRAASGFLELARADIAADSESGYFLGRAAAAAELADRMTARLVAYLRILPAADPTSFDPATVIDQAVARCDDELDVVVGPLPGVVADRARFVDAVVEILDNAARYRAEGLAPQVTITGRVEDSWAVLRFIDNGFGIEAERIERAFEMFRQVHRVGENPGSGMGLPIARRCIEAQGGTMTLEPGAGGGAVVEIRLPAASGH